MVLPVLLHLLLVELHLTLLLLPLVLHELHLLQALLEILVDLLFVLDDSCLQLQAFLLVDQALIQQVLRTAALHRVAPAGRLWPVSTSQVLLSLLLQMLQVRIVGRQEVGARGRLVEQRLLLRSLVKGEAEGVPVTLVHRLSSDLRHVGSARVAPFEQLEAFLAQVDTAALALAPLLLP